MTTTAKIIFRMNYQGHELTVTEDQRVTHKGETCWLWQLPIAMRNDVEIAHMRAMA